MESKAYEVEAEVEDRHWWFVGRRRLFSKLIKEMNLKPDDLVLDLGSGTGANLRLISQLGFTRSVGIDRSLDALRFCRGKGFGSVLQADAVSLPLADGTLALVLATDILEHVEDEDAFLREISRVLKPDGKAIITVPAFEALWGIQDELSHHRRRYRSGRVVKLVGLAGLNLCRAFYFNFILFLPILFVRKVLWWTRRDIRSENEVNWPVLNAVLTFIFSMDVRLSAIFAPPFGVSFLVVVKRPGAESRR